MNWVWCWEHASKGTGRRHCGSPDRSCRPRPLSPSIHGSRSWSKLKGRPVCRSRVRYFEGIDSERGIAWRATDSLVVRHLLGSGLGERSPDRSVLSRTRRLIAVEMDEQVLGCVLRPFAARRLLTGKTVGGDATTVETNAAMWGIGCWDTGDNYPEFLAGFAKESGIETPTCDQLSQLDRMRRKRMSNEDWKDPRDPDAPIAKRKYGSTHRADQAVHPVVASG